MQNIKDVIYEMCREGRFYLIHQDTVSDAEALPQERQLPFIRKMMKNVIHHRDIKGFRGEGKRHILFDAHELHPFTERREQVLERVHADHVQVVPASQAVRDDAVADPDI